MIEWLDLLKDLMIVGYTAYKWYTEITRQSKKRSRRRNRRKR